MLMTAIALAFLLLGLALTARQLRIGLASRNWPAVEGEILDSGAVFAGRDFDTDEPQYDARVTYRYRVDDQTYQGCMIRVLPWLIGRESADRMPQLYPAGTAVRVHYDPDHPASSILEPGIRPGIWIGMSIYLGVCMLLLGQLVGHWGRHG